MIVLVTTYNTDEGAFPIAVSDSFTDAKYRAAEHNAMMETGKPSEQLTWSDTEETYALKWGQMFGGMRGKGANAFYDIQPFEVNSEDEMTKIA